MENSGYKCYYKLCKREFQNWKIFWFLVRNIRCFKITTPSLTTNKKPKNQQLFLNPSENWSPRGQTAALKVGETNRRMKQSQFIGENPKWKSDYVPLIHDIRTSLQLKVTRQTERQSTQFAEKEQHQKQIQICQDVGIVIRSIQTTMINMLKALMDKCKSRWARRRKMEMLKESKWILDIKTRKWRMW